MKGLNFGEVHLLVLILIYSSNLANAKRRSCRIAAQKAFPKLDCTRASIDQDCTDFCQNLKSCDDEAINKPETFSCPKSKRPIKFCCCYPCIAKSPKRSSNAVTETSTPKGNKMERTGWATHGMQLENESSWGWTTANSNATPESATSEEITSTISTSVAPTDGTHSKGMDYFNENEYHDAEDDDAKSNRNGQEKQEIEEEDESTTKLDLKFPEKSSISQPDCRANILKKYPDAECSKSQTKESCRMICEAQGDGICQGSQGEIHKLNCRGEKPDEQGLITCCCSVKCESVKKTKARLEEAFDKENNGTEENSGICLEVPREDIKERLKEECKTNDKVFVARKYCIEEKEGHYFCVKDGKCFGTHCKGCLKHECEIGRNKVIMNPPEAYMDEHLKSKDFDKTVAVNVDDMEGVVKNKQWCTQLKDRADCKPTCKEFGDRLCGGHALKYDHDDYCKRDAEECKCCCQPVCQPGVPSDKTNLLEPMDSEHEDAIAKSVEEDYKRDETESEDHEYEEEDDYKSETSNYEMESSTSGAESNFQRR